MDLQSLVQDYLDDLVDRNEESGLQCAVYVEGELAADAVAGTVDGQSGTPIQPDHLCTIFSTSKGIAVTAIHILAERGVLDYNARVADYWPAFGVAGKGDIEVIQVLNHLAGIPQVPQVGDSPHLVWCDLDRIVAETAALEPIFERGSTSCYHGFTLGWILEGLVRQVDGRTLGTFIRDEIATPLGTEKGDPRGRAQSSDDDPPTA